MEKTDYQKAVKKGLKSFERLRGMQREEKIKEIQSLMDTILGDFKPLKRYGGQIGYEHGDGRWIEIRNKIGDLKN